MTLLTEKIPDVVVNGYINLIIQLSNVPDYTEINKIQDTMLIEIDNKVAAAIRQADLKILRMRQNRSRLMLLQIRKQTSIHL